MSGEMALRHHFTAKHHALHLAVGNCLELFPPISKSIFFEFSSELEFEILWGDNQPKCQNFSKLNAWESFFSLLRYLYLNFICNDIGTNGNLYSALFLNGLTSLGKLTNLAMTNIYVRLFSSQYIRTFFRPYLGKSRVRFCLFSFLSFFLSFATVWYWISQSRSITASAWGGSSSSSSRSQSEKSLWVYT